MTLHSHLIRWNWPIRVVQSDVVNQREKTRGLSSNPDEIKAVWLDVEPFLTRGNPSNRCWSRVEEILVVGRASLQCFAREIHTEDEEDEK